MAFIIDRIVSGGQTGADRAALDWAISRGIAHDGWCPAGRKAEDGRLDDDYRLRETPSGAYIVRTEWNVRDSDGTVVFTLTEEVTGGSLATLRWAARLEKPHIHISQAATPDPGGALRKFVLSNGIDVLNVAGPRGSGESEIDGFVREALEVGLRGS